MSFYAVRVGRQTGVFDTWDKCTSLVNGFSGAQFKKFKTSDEAWSFVNAGSSAGVPKSVNTDSATRNASNIGGKSLTRDMSRPSSACVKLLSPTGPVHAQAVYRLGRSAAVAGPVLGRKRKLPPEVGRSYSTNQTAGADRESPNVDSLDGAQPSAREEAVPRSDHLHCKQAKMVAESSLDPDGYTVVYTDGACHGNGKKLCAAGIGVYWGPGHASNIGERLEGRQTNNHAEIKAACRAIQQAKEMGVQKLCIRTDSKFLIDCVTKWMPGWKKRGWKTSAGGAVKNQEELLVLDRLLALGCVAVKWEHVAAHVGIIGNEIADSLASEGARKPLP